MSKTIGERKVLKVNVWSDEYETLGLDSDMTRSEAVTEVRDQLGLIERHTSSGHKTAVRRALKDATPEQIARAMSALQDASADQEPEADEESEPVEQAQ